MDKNKRPNALLCSTRISEFYVSIVDQSIIISDEENKCSNTSFVIDMKNAKAEYAAAEETYKLRYKRKTPPEGQALVLWKTEDKSFRIKRKNIYKPRPEGTFMIGGEKPIAEVFSLTYQTLPKHETTILRFEAQKGQKLKLILDSQDGTKNFGNTTAT